MPRVVDGGKLAVQHTSFGVNDSNNPGNNHTPDETSESTEALNSDTSSESSFCESTDTPTSLSTSTYTPSTTSVVVHMPTGQVNATSLEWTIVWRRCEMPSSAVFSTFSTTSKVTFPPRTTVSVSTETATITSDEAAESSAAP
ncbi:hypothetical protein NEMBOFW57_001240 [Staphylotrichum longicolle]|uniref:Uncharacterized protein n=1 Tax=Staphylotrichum longicolle TaxID=669026 RepID=A0AAD4I3K8_9PEZI|nr:hypothetical protein NEMBOFW57_001240 [Staphylotrichum longicolle]